MPKIALNRAKVAPSSGTSTAGGTRLVEAELSCRGAARIIKQ